MQIKLYLLLLCAFPVLSGSIINAQTQLTAEEVDAYKMQSEQMIKYLEGTINFLGDPNEVASEKDIIINESYKKIFVDEDVQIEDDLDEMREMSLSKDVQAYLKDVDFFYKKVEFSFDVSQVENFVNDEGQIFFKVTVNRNLKGITINDDSVNNNQIRYVEINLNAIDKDLKIASIYTNLPNRKHEMAWWWNNLSEGWQDYFGQGILVFDTLPITSIISFNDSSLVVPRWFEKVTMDSIFISANDTLFFNMPTDSVPEGYSLAVLADTISQKQPDTIKTNCSEIYSAIKQMWKRNKVAINGNILIGNLKPLSELSDLEEIDFSNTLIDDISPLRNLNKLRVIKASGTPLSNLEQLRYASALSELDISNTAIVQTGVLLNLNHLEKLNISNTLINSLDTISNITSIKSLKLNGLQIFTENEDLSKLNLEEIDLNRTNVRSLQLISSNNKLQSINIDSTEINDLSPISALSNLNVLRANFSKISDIHPLSGIKNLRLIYCDNSLVNRDEAMAFKKKRPDCTVIYNTDELRNWWQSLDEDWQSIAHSRMKLSSPISKEELHEIISIKTVNLSGNKSIKSLEPLRMLYSLEELNVENCNVSDISPLAALNNLKYLNLNSTKTTSLSGLEGLQNLEVVKIENTSISRLEQLYDKAKLKFVYADKTNLTIDEVKRFKQNNYDCIVVFRSGELKMWWDNLDDEWQEIFKVAINISFTPNNEQLHQIVDLKELKIKSGIRPSSLEALSLFYLLEEFEAGNAGIQDISPLSFLPEIKSISLPNNPVYDISSLAKTKTLQELNLENTSIEDLRPLAGLNNLVKLNIAGTKVKNLKYLQSLNQLKYLSINNTSVKSLKSLMGLELVQIKCYNTKLKSSKIDDFKLMHPDTEVVFY